MASPSLLATPRYWPFPRASTIPPRPLRTQVCFAVYEAQLTANLTISQLQLPVKGITDIPRAQIRGTLGEVCSQGGAAYTAWLLRQFPTMQINTNGVTTDLMLTEYSAGRCEAMIVDGPVAQARTPPAPTFQCVP